MEFGTEEAALIWVYFLFFRTDFIGARAKKLTSFLPVCGKSTVYAPELILLVRAKQ